MAKRSWDEVEPDAAATRDAKREPGISPTTSEPNGVDDHGNGDVAIPQISRKVKACAACRKQKIKCLMDEHGPPCRRCIDRNLSCVLNKSLQSLLDEKQQLSEAFAHDLATVHSALRVVVERLGLPPLAPLQSSSRDAPMIPEPELPVPRPKEAGPSCDNSPKLSPADEDLPYVPIQSLYHLTKMSALRSLSDNEVVRPANGAPDPASDFISRGLITEREAERLFKLYHDRLDHYMYGIGARYNSLADLRRGSPILTACICTIAALHDPESNSTYGVCSQEFRQLMAGSMFDRLVHRDSLRAMCVAAYWLSDISWMISGYAIRRAAEFNLHNSFSRVLAENSEDAADCLRLWYILYICDQHLATLYGRPAIVQEDFSLQGCEKFLECSVSTDQDKRLVSQVALLLIFRQIREFFGPDTGKPTPQVFLTQIASFNRQLDNWIGQWSTTLKEKYDHVAGFPRKGALMHFYFARLHLHSHVFRGLRDAAVPAHFHDCAANAVQSAMSIVDLILRDSDVRDGLVGMPSYLLSMTAFTCMFLIKICTKYGDAFIDPDRVYVAISELVHEFRTIPAGKWHLVRLMAGGLEKMVLTLKQGDRGRNGSSAGSGGAKSRPHVSAGAGFVSDGAPFGGMGDEFPSDWGEGTSVPGLDGSMFFDYNMSFGLSPVVQFDPSALGMEGQIRGF